MKSIVAAVICVLSINAYSALKVLEPSQSIKAQDLNSNFNHIKEIFETKRFTIPFQSFTSGELIQKDELESNFDLIRALGVDVQALSEGKINSGELNKSFLDMSLGVNEVDDVPSASPATFSLNEDTPFSSQVTFANAVGISNVVVTTLPSHGNLAINPATGLFTYTPVLDYHGADSFSFKVEDGKNSSPVASIQLTIASQEDLPQTLASADIMSEDISKSISLPYTDGDSDLATSCSATNLSNLTLDSPCACLNGVCTVAIKGLPNYFGVASFDYSVVTKTHTSNVSTKSIAISSVNDPMSVSPQSISLATRMNTSYSGNVLASDSDGLNYSISAQGAKGVASINSAGAFIYVPTTGQYGYDTFTILVSDGQTDNISIIASVSMLNKTCTIDNGTGVQSVNPTTGALGTCMVESCNSAAQYFANPSNTMCILGELTGGSIQVAGDYKIHTFYYSGTTVNISSLANLPIEYLIVGGGGGGAGGYDNGAGNGGGGAGGFRSSFTTLSSGTSTLRVGRGGDGGTGVKVSNASLMVGKNGENSYINNIISIGGGGGGSAGTVSGQSGGSGGGSGGYNMAIGSGTAGQGNDGGHGVWTSSPHVYRGGGGGGAGGAGSSGSSGNGGGGLASSISGASTLYAGGGGGGSYYVTTAGAGGSGIGGAGAPGGGTTIRDGGSAVANTGSGGGGGNSTTVGAARGGHGGRGSDGIIIIKYKYK